MTALGGALCAYARSTPDQKLSLSAFRRRPVILVFYAEDWSPVCSDQLGLYQELLPEFERFDAQLATRSRQARARLASGRLIP